MLFQQDDPGDALYVCAEGNVACMVVLDSGERLRVARRGSGDVLGEFAPFIPGGRRSASVVGAPGP